MLSCVGIATGSALASTLTASVTLDPFFRDSAVLAADRPIAVTGSGARGEQVEVAFGAATVTAVADESGRWRATLPAQPASVTPRDLVAKGSSVAIAKDVVVGELWIIAGQTNMALALSASTDGAIAVANANDTLLRFFTVSGDYTALDAEFVNGTWQVATPETAAAWSAIGYHFGHQLRSAINVPVGVIQVTWPGSRIESWMPRWSIDNDSDLSMSMRQLEGRRREAPPASDAEKAKRRAQREVALGKYIERFWQSQLPDLPSDWTKTVPGASWGVDWLDTILPATFDDIDPSLAGFRGSLVVSRAVEIPAAWEGKELTVALGELDETDRFWANGTFIAETFAAAEQARSYRIPGKLVRAGAMTLSLGIISSKTGGGFTSASSELWIAPTDADASARISLAGTWKWLKGPRWRGSPTPRLADEDATTKKIGEEFPGAIWNARMAPIMSSGVRGIAWYQGESNASDPSRYRRMLPGFIRGVRRASGDEALPIAIVQLAPYSNFDASAPAPGGWAELREAQRRAAKAEDAGLISLMDLGEASNLMPPGKAEVGNRLARWALATTHGRDVAWSGPQYKSMERRGDAIVITFDDAGGLRTRDGKALAGFAIAGEDGVFSWADARIEGISVIVRSDKVTAPKTVRYGWQSNPANANLVNGAGFPASSFQTDEPVDAAKKAH